MLVSPYDVKVDYGRNLSERATILKEMKLSVKEQFKIVSLLNNANMPLQKYNAKVISSFVTKMVVAGRIHGNYINTFLCVSLGLKRVSVDLYHSEDLKTGTNFSTCMSTCSISRPFSNGILDMEGKSAEVSVRFNWTCWHWRMFRYFQVVLYSESVLFLTSTLKLFGSSLLLSHALKVQNGQWASRSQRRVGASWARV